MTERMAARGNGLLAFTSHFELFKAYGTGLIAVLIISFLFIMNDLLFALCVIKEL